jgi:hypothetical protein
VNRWLLGAVLQECLTNEVILAPGSEVILPAECSWMKLAEIEEFECK